MNGDITEMADEKVGDTDDFASTATAETQSVIRPYGYSVSKCGYCKGSRSHLLQTNERATTTTPHQTPNHTSSNSLSYPSSSPTSSSSSSPTSKSSKSSKSYSVLADSISPSLYEELINRGWRRSGVHLYKPQNFSSCCPTLTIRLLTREFKPTKSQRKILKKMENILRPLPSVRKEGEIPTARATATTAIATPMSMLKATSTPKKTKKKPPRKTKILSSGNNRNAFEFRQLWQSRAWDGQNIFVVFIIARGTNTSEWNLTETRGSYDQGNRKML
mmetsp:Transcript_19812/g.42983  ORF Transcript_19812/g.42983 Transcript_19812/m.42983 type:complete len:275 (+) Transcript_19812:270-1094(+)